MGVLESVSESNYDFSGKRNNLVVSVLENWQMIYTVKGENTIQLLSIKHKPQKVPQKATCSHLDCNKQAKKGRVYMSHGGK